MSTETKQSINNVVTFSAILQENKPVYSQIKFGKYQVRLANNQVDQDYFMHTLDTNNPWAQLSVTDKNDKEYLIDGLYAKPSSTQMIVRFIMTEGEYKDYIFTVYVSKIDFQVMLRDIVAQAGLTKSNPLDIIRYMSTHDISLWYGQHESLDKMTGEKKIFSKWAAHELKEIIDTPVVVPTEDDGINILEVDDAC